MSIYIKNIKVISINLSDNWFILVFFSILASIFLYLISIVLKPFFPHIGVLFTAFTLCLIIEGNFLQYNFGELNGQEIDWSSYRLKIWLDSFFWLAILITSFLFSRYIYKNSKSISLILLAFLIVTIFFDFLSNPVPEKKESIFTNNNEWFKFSTEHNIVVLILDSFRAEAFSKVLESYPEYNEVFKDFTFFENTTGGYPTTYPSVPLILSGLYFDNSVPISEFINSVEGKTLPVVMKQNGFEVQNFNSEFFESVYDNASDSMPLNTILSLTRREYLIAAIRYAPLVFKRSAIDQYYRGNDYSHKNMVVFNDLTKEIQAVKGRPVFKFAHLTGAHRPFQLDADLNYTNEGYYEQAAASLKVTKDLLQEMKAKGVYDNSLIFILGDHGTPITGENIENGLAYMYQPFLLVKKVNQKSDSIQISSSPVSLSDIPQTIVSEQGLDVSYPGYSVFEEIPADRTRRWFYYQWKNSFWKEDYIEPMFEFAVDGPANNNESYTLIRRASPNTTENFTYELGENMVSTFLSVDILRMLYAENFTYGEDDGSFAWSIGPEACIHLPVEKVNKPLTLVFQAEPFLVDGQLADQKMTIQLDNVQLAELQRDDIQEVLIPASLAASASQDGQFDICFSLPDANKSPKDYGVSKNNYLLGYKFTEISLR